MSETLQIATWLRDARGFSVIAVDHPDATTQTDPKKVGKVPTFPWKIFETMHPTDDNLRAWFGNGRPRNVGIVCGAISGLVAVDLDSPEALAWAVAHLPPTEMRTGTARGEHWFYRHPGGTIKNQVKLGTGDTTLDIDIRADGGQVLAPGSKHASGVLYRRLGTWPPVSELPPFDPAWLAPDTAAAPAPASHKPLAPPRSAPTSLPDHGRLLDRARAYLRSVPGAVEGNGGDHHTFVAACRLVRDFGLSTGDALDLLREWNATCKPAWSESDLQEKIDSAVKSGSGTIGSLRDMPPARSEPPRSAHHAPASDPPVNDGPESDEWIGDAPDVEPHAADAPLILDPGDPLPSARAFTTARHLVDGVLALRHQAGLFYVFQRETSCYRDVEEAAIRAAVYAFLEAQLRWTKPSGRGAPKLVPFAPNTHKVSNVVDALRAHTVLSSTSSAPCWLHGEPGLDPFEILAGRNGLLHIPSRTFVPATPTFFALNGLNFAIDLDAPPPESWLHFLDSLWPGDAESQETLQEWVGYLLTPRTHFQKILLVVGPKRSGKGTIGRVIRQLLGERNVCGPTLANLSEQFGLSILIGKPAAIVSDARIGGRADVQVIAERLLSISGEDTLSVPRKFLVDWNGKLPTRFTLMTNELPRLEDASGALASRFLLLTLTESFYGREDHDLFSRFIPELPGILNWALAGWDRLYTRGRFVQPAAAESVIREFEDLGSPINAFLRERCEVGKGFETPVDKLFDAWKAWCVDNGREHPGTTQTFGRNLRAAVPWLGTRQPRLAGYRLRYYEGLRLRENEE